MTKMTISQLEKYLDTKCPSSVTFEVDNQDWDRVENPINFCLTFPIILIASNPNVICLKNESNTVYFERIKYVNIDESGTPLGTILQVICGDSKRTDHDICFTLIVS